MRCIAVINQKGGVGKTTTTVNIGAAFANAGHKVLLLDIDPQANLTLHLDRRPEGDTPTMTDMLVEQASLRDMICDTSTEGLYMVPADTSLSGVESQLANRIGREMILREALEHIAAEGCAAVPGGKFDYVFFDCPPSLGVLSANALVAAEHVIIPMQAEYFSMQGMTKLMEVMGLVRKSLNPAIDICLILPCMVDRRTNLSNEVLSELRRHFGDVLANTCIRSNVKLAEAPSFGRTIFEHAPESNGARDYQIVADELLQRLEGTFQPEEMEEPEEEVEAVELIVADEPAPEPDDEPRREDLESEFAVAVSYMAEVSGEDFMPEPLRRADPIDDPAGTPADADDQGTVPTTAAADSAPSPPGTGDDSGETTTAEAEASVEEPTPPPAAESPATEKTTDETPTDETPPAGTQTVTPQYALVVVPEPSPETTPEPMSTDQATPDPATPGGDSRAEGPTTVADPGPDPAAAPDPVAEADQPETPPVEETPAADPAGANAPDPAPHPDRQDPTVTIPNAPDLSEETTEEEPVSTDSTLHGTGSSETTPQKPAVKPAP